MKNFKVVAVRWRIMMIWFFEQSFHLWAFKSDLKLLQLYLPDKES